MGSTFTHDTLTGMCDNIGLTSNKSFLRLDSRSSPGLPERDFQKLFAKCRACGAVMTRRVTVHHRCSKVLRHSNRGESTGGTRVVIDLTIDDSSAGSDIIDLSLDSD
jgi:hypothetical protein